MEKLSIIKVGGKVVEQEASLMQLLTGFAAIQSPKMLVHGGGRLATAFAERLGIESKLIDGRRITDRQMLDIVTMVYGGLVNKQIVARLQALNINALGLTGADLNCIRSERRPATAEVDFGFVGDVKQVDGSVIADLLGKGVVPVFAPLTHDRAGNLLNTNADTIAAEIARAFATTFDVTLIYCFEKKGVLRDQADDLSVIPHLDYPLYQQYIQQGIIRDGMIPKLDNAFAALRAGVKRVIITRADAMGEGTEIN